MRVEWGAQSRAKLKVPEIVGERTFRFGASAEERGSAEEDLGRKLNTKHHGTRVLQKP